MAGLDVNLYAFLSAAAGVAALVGDGNSPETYRVFPNFAGENPALPCLVYTRISRVEGHTFDGPHGFCRSRIQIDVLADTYTQAAALAAQVKAALHGYSGSFGTMSAHYARLETVQDFYEDAGALSRIAMDFIITHTED
jgi:hypothetical protein